jgi:hypothetical protein
VRGNGFLLLCALVFAVLAWLGARVDDMTYDEGNFLTYGLQHLEGRVERDQALNSKLPVTALHAIPVEVVRRGHEGAIYTVLPNGSARLAVWALLPARLPAIALGAVLVVAVGLGARALMGRRAGQAAALFAALEPNLVAHGHLVTADGGATLATFLSALATVRFVRTKAPVDAVLVGASLGLCLLCKFVLLAWIPLVVLAIVVKRALGVRSAAIAALAFVVVLDAGFAFRGLPGRLPVPPKSHKVSLVEMVVGRAPLPVPDDWLLGLDWTAGDEEIGHGFGNLYSCGELQRGTERRGFLTYYLVAFGLKLPLPLIALAIVAMFVAAPHPGPPPASRGEGDGRSTTRLLALGWLVFLTFFNKAQLGIRHALPITPLLILEAAAAYAWLETRRPWVARGLVVWLAASVLSFAPDFIPYTNELVWNRKLAYRWLADSNLDWGQAQSAAVDYVTANPGVVPNPEGPVKSRVIVSVNALVGILVPPERYAWLRERTPVGHVRHAYLLYDAREP